METENGILTERTGSPEFYIFTSYLWQSPGLNGIDHHYNISLHRNRLIAAAQAFNLHQVHSVLVQDINCKQLIESVERHLTDRKNTKKGWTKIKLCIYADVRLHIESTNIHPMDEQDPFPQPPDFNTIFSSTSSAYCRLRLDTQSVSPSLFSRHKTSERSQYNRARKAAGIEHDSPCVSEVLLFNPNSEISECSLSTPYFQRRGRWVTPPLSSGGNAGVSRSMAITAGLCGEGVVSVESVRDQELVWISNAVRGFIPAKVDLANHH